MILLQPMKMTLSPHHRMQKTVTRKKPKSPHHQMKTTRTMRTMELVDLRTAGFMSKATSRSVTGTVAAVEVTTNPSAPQYLN